MAGASALSDLEWNGLESPRPDSVPSALRVQRRSGHASDPSTGQSLVRTGEPFERAILAFMALGVLLRVAHYIANYPLWGDEAFLALSFVRRGYLDLLQPLEFGQICPILFLWAELTAVKLCGFSEMSLRLCPLLCGVGSVFLFRHVAGRILTGAAGLMAVAIFAVSIHPIRHSADAKPYASDLLAALVLLALAIEWYRARERTGWLWLLVGFAPVALAVSYPAVLVAGGIGLALAPAVWKSRRWKPVAALAAYFVTLATTLLALQFGYIGNQRGTGTLLALQNYWADSFPPLDSPVRLVSWLIRTHAGSMLAYPGGGNRGASSLTLILVLMGVVVCWRRRQRTVLSLLLMPMALGLFAAAIKLYPYGGQARIMQYLAPAFCLLAGAGLGALLGALPLATVRIAALRVTSIAMVIMGTSLLVGDLRHPYRAIYDYQAREFARRYWPAQAQNAELACLYWDFGIHRKDAAGARIAIYLCNQYIYSPNRRRGGGPNWSAVTSSRPLQCMVFDDEVLKRPEATAWLQSMKKRFVLRGRSAIDVQTTGLDAKPWSDHITIFEFRPIRADREFQLARGLAGQSITR